MRISNVISGAIGFGLLGAAVSAGYYMGLSPRSQKTMQKSLKRTMHDLSDVAENVSDTIQSIKK